MNKFLISETGYWTQEMANTGHAFSSTLCESIMELLEKEKQIIDFGCGFGDYLKKFSDNGYKNLLGVEGFQLSNFNFNNIIIQDLSEDFDLNLKGNVISLEVGEHLPPQYEDIFIENITKHCDNLLIISWALPGQGGYGHYNEKPNDYIIEKIVNKDFIFLEKETKQLREYPEDFCCGYFRKTIMVFKKINL